MTEASLVNKTSLRVRFSEVDSMQIVWHGEYVRYFEDGREAFGREFAGLGYMDIYASGYTAPVVELHLQYRKPLKVNDTAVDGNPLYRHRGGEGLFRVHDPQRHRRRSGGRRPVRRRCSSTAGANCNCSRRNSTANGKSDGK